MSDTEDQGDQGDAVCAPEDHDWVYDGFFWYVCDVCGAVS